MPERATFTNRSSFFRFSLTNWRSFCQSLAAPTVTTITMATTMATPSTHSTFASVSPGVGLTDWKMPRAREMTAATVKRIRTLSLYAIHANCQMLLDFFCGSLLSPKMRLRSEKELLVVSAGELIVPEVADLLRGRGPSSFSAAPARVASSKDTTPSRPTSSTLKPLWRSVRKPFSRPGSPPRA